MACLDMKGPYELTKEVISSNVTQTKPGNYALGRLDEENSRFWVDYVGRADSDVARRLGDHIGEKYTHFKFSYASSPWQAFLKECQNYHDFGESKTLDNKIHPDRPAGTNWKCPCCDKFGE